MVRLLRLLFDLALCGCFEAGINNITIPFVLIPVDAGEERFVNDQGYIIDDVATCDCATLSNAQRDRSVMNSRLSTAIIPSPQYLPPTKDTKISRFNAKPVPSGKG